MKDEYRAVLVNYRIEQAREAVTDGKLLYENGSYRSAINRAYYGMFYAVLALLVSREMEARKHAGIIALFDREFVPEL